MVDVACAPTQTRRTDGLVYGHEEGRGQRARREYKTPIMLTNAAQLSGGVREWYWEIHDRVVWGEMDWKGKGGKAEREKEIEGEREGKCQWVYLAKGEKIAKERERGREEKTPGEAQKNPFADAGIHTL